MSSLKQDRSYVDIPKHSSKELQPFKFETCICMSIQKKGGVTLKWLWIFY